MTPEQQVCNLEQSRRLKELGVVAPAQITWGKVLGEYRLFTGSRSEHSEVINAYSVAELGAMLTLYNENVAEAYYCHKTKCWFWHVIRHNTFEQLWASKIEFLTEAECRASLLTELLETNLLTADECNKSIQ